MPRLVAAPDKFRGTASADEAARAIAAAAVRAGWEADRCAMSDGGEGFVAAMGGEVRTATVRGPLGEPVRARYSVREDGTAVVESAEACGRALLPHPKGDDPVEATTEGVGDLVIAALEAGATALVVGCGGSATTDGGSGCLRALEDAGTRVDVPLTVACDVDARFCDAARTYGPQKGATESQVAELTERLKSLAAAYSARYGIDVTAVDGTGAAGGLAGALVAVGGTVARGAELVAETRGLREELDGAGLVVTGEGRLDRGTLEGKVVAVVLALAPRLPALVVAGAIDDGVATALKRSRPGATDVVALDADTQRELGTVGAIEATVAGHLAERGRA